jgi:hypothetical protein
VVPTQEERQGAVFAMLAAFEPQTPSFGIESIATTQPLVAYLETL